jgi:hypothetical protein
MAPLGLGGPIVKTLTLTRFSLAVAVAASACSNKGDADDDVAEATDTGTTGDPEPDDDTTGSTGEAEDDESTTGDANEAVYGGQVLDFVPPEAGIADALITVYDMPGIEAVSEADGSYEIGPLPLDPPPIFVVAPGDDYFGSIRPVRAVETSNPDNIRLGQVDRETIEEQIEFLAAQEPAEADLEQGIIIVRLINLQATGATLELDPPPEEGTYYAPNSQGSPVLNSNAMEFALLPVVVYFNVEPGAPGDYVFTASHPERECTIPRPDFPVLPGHITLVEVSCPAS